MEQHYRFWQVSLKDLMLIVGISVIASLLLAASESIGISYWLLGFEIILLLIPLSLIFALALVIHRFIKPNEPSFSEWKVLRWARMAWLTGLTTWLTTILIQISPWDTMYGAAFIDMFIVFGEIAVFMIIVNALFFKFHLAPFTLLIVNLSTFLACLFVFLGYIAIDSFFLPGFRLR